MSEGDSTNSPKRRDVCARRLDPSAAWICGYDELGKGCACGPTAKGRCGLATAGEHNDGAAASGSELTPCIPRRSYRWRRQALCLNLAILTGGVLLLCMALPSRENTFVPGELSSKHAQILDNTLVSQRCGLCHPNSHVGDRIGASVEAMLGNQFSGQYASHPNPGNESDEPLRFFGSSDGGQDALCMQCHRAHMPGAAKRTPHDLSPSALEALTRDAQSPAWQTVGNRSSSVAGPDPHHAAPIQTNCADCHVEHHGRGFELKAMADDRCQACHRRKFESFTSGHPEFKNFPAQRSRSLAFSHQLHADKHFPQKNRDFDCGKCHLDRGRPGTSGPIARSVSFEAACAECHQEPIRAASADGWAVLQLPSIDASAAAENASLEHWPAEARFGYEGKISPVLRALLEADETAREALGHLPASGELADVPSIGDQREQVTAALALATERLIRQTARDGQAAWRERLLQVTRARTQRELTAGETALVEAMCAGLPPDLFRQMQLAWFDRAGQPLASAPQPSDKDSDEATVADRAASSQTAATKPPPLSLVQSDPLRVQPRRRQGIVVERQTSGLLVTDESAGDSLTSDASTAGESLLLDESASASSDLLAPHSANSSVPDSNLIDSNLIDSNLLDSELLGDDSLVDDAWDRAGSHAASVQSTAPLAGMSHLAGGGWYLDGQTLALRYMPTGHADKMFAAWSLWWTLFADESVRDIPHGKAQPASASTVTPGIPQQIPGGCVQCHRLKDTAGTLQAGLLVSAWRVPQRPLGTKEFTKFDHAPHLSLPAVNDCRYCHALRDAAPGAYGRLVSTAGESHATAVSMSEFREMRLGQCVACHRPNGANSGCLQCHNYHVTQRAEEKASYGPPHR